MSIQITFTVETTEEAQALLQKFCGSTAAKSTSSSSTPTANTTSTETESSETSTLETEPPSLLVSATVRKYAEDNGVDVTTIEGTGKDGRILKKDVTAAITVPAAPPSTPDEEDDDLEVNEGGDEDDDDIFGDLEDDEPEEPAATKEDVRKAMVALQSAIRDKYIGDGEDETEAKKKAIDKTRGFLKKISGSDTLGGIDEEKYASIVEKANAQLAKLSK